MPEPCNGTVSGVTAVKSRVTGIAYVQLAGPTTARYLVLNVYVFYMVMCMSVYKVLRL